MEELCEYKLMLFARRTCGYSPFYKGFYGRVGTYMTPNLFWFRGVGIAENSMPLPKRPVQSAAASLLSHLTKSLHEVSLKPIKVGYMIEGRIELIVCRSEIGGRIA